MNFSKLNRKTFLVSTLITLICVPVFFSLGYWQIMRADEKERLQSEYDLRSNDWPVKIEGQLQQVESLRFHNVEAQGSYEFDRQILIDNRIYQGKVGYYVVTPFHIKGSNFYVLVNRGWVPIGGSREQLPEAQGSGNLRVITGVAKVPLMNRFQFGAPIADINKWQTRWQYIDMDLYQKVSGLPIQPVIILLDEDSDADGFTRKWQRLDTGIAVHQGYAFQWFAMAAALFVIYLFLNIKAIKAK